MPPRRSGLGPGVGSAARGGWEERVRISHLMGLGFVFPKLSIAGLGSVLVVFQGFPGLQSNTKMSAERNICRGRKTKNQKKRGGKKKEERKHRRMPRAQLWGDISKRYLLTKTQNKTSRGGFAFQIKATEAFCFNSVWCHGEVCRSRPGSLCSTCPSGTAALRVSPPGGIAAPGPGGSRSPFQGFHARKRNQRPRNKYRRDHGAHRRY